jgi:hypothetical protein
MKKSHSCFDKQVICFMSDGQSSYPTSIIETMKADKQVMTMMEFMSVGYGASH